ncbi:hypothetical protein DBT_1960 [Dissulfuribacter thermophilus]|uniref:Uncharacterized protein n=1 Tax=Dissulfuribacter thermophilus TaxID=1156395 RepID=A0A1B9F4A1_9BACT|nr:hypothetical protein [Dissulfuribacter thermophilus]OCC14645.1 hypothetical protein DBT_1960 [Dissulfuribacter thermophilus]
MQIKTIGNSGQITLGKKYSGRQVIVEEIEHGVWLIKTGRFVPDSEAWLYKGDMPSKLNRAIKWAEDNPPAETNEDCVGKGYYQYKDLTQNPYILSESQKKCVL